jgi:hypothetical protein
MGKIINGVDDEVMKPGLDPKILKLHTHCGRPLVIPFMGEMDAGG